MKAEKRLKSRLWLMATGSHLFLAATRKFLWSVDSDVHPEEQARLSTANAVKDQTAGLIRLLQQSWQLIFDAVQLNRFWKRHKLFGSLCAKKETHTKTSMSV